MVLPPSSGIRYSVKLIQAEPSLWIRIVAKLYLWCTLSFSPLFILFRCITRLHQRKVALVCCIKHLPKLSKHAFFDCEKCTPFSSPTLPCHTTPHHAQNTKPALYQKVAINQELMFDSHLQVLFYGRPPNSQLLFSELGKRTPFSDFCQGRRAEGLRCIKKLHLTNNLCLRGTFKSWLMQSSKFTTFIQGTGKRTPFGVFDEPVGLGTASNWKVE